MHPQLRAWAQLLRVPNTLTACADVFAGFAIAAGAWFQLTAGSWLTILPTILVAGLGSICLYWAGMVLNDVNDIEVDRAQRRGGPLVDGRISFALAQKLGWGLLCVGVLLAATAAYLVPKSSAQPLAPWLVLSAVLFLAASIVIYDSRFKATFIGPFLMGLCRGLNLLTGILLGACIIWPENSEWIGIGCAVFGHIAFVMGVTLAARREGLMQQSKAKLAFAWSVSLVGVASVASCSLWATTQPLRLAPESMFPLLVCLLMLPWLRRAYISVTSPGIMTLVPAIKQAILSIIFLDAAITLQFANSLPGILVCGLAIPTVALGRLFRMT